jgi:hypothetical protein
MSRERLEADKKEGVSYALTDDGIELPVIDVTHGAFKVKLDPLEHDALIEQYENDQEPLSRMNPLLRRALLRLVLRGSVLARAIRQSRGTYLSGLGTYLLKLGPDNLGKAYAKRIDARIAASLPALGARVRLQDVAAQLANALKPLLAAKPKAPVRFICIAGGPCIDAQNALILARSALSGHAVQILDLDIDDAGASFGKRALAALKSEGGALHGIDAELTRTSYDWNAPESLAPLLGDFEGIQIGSSEGGLFEYGSDDAIVGNLKILHAATPADFVMVGSVTRNDAPTRLLIATGNAALVPRGLDEFRALAERGGWEIAHVVERFFSDQVALRKRA